MMCEQCGKNPATTHVHTVINGVSAQKNLCTYCAVASGYAGFQSGGLMNMLSSVFGDSLAAHPTSNEKRCNCCGATFSDIAESGKAGCADCYREFGPQLMSSLQRMHGKTKHVGKVPQSASGEVRAAAYLQNLKDELAQAVASEEFEKAAKLRDQIKQVEAGENHE